MWGMVTPQVFFIAFRISIGCWTKTRSINILYIINSTYIHVYIRTKNPSPPHSKYAQSPHAGGTGSGSGADTAHTTSTSRCGMTENSPSVWKKVQTRYAFGVSCEYISKKIKQKQKMTPPVTYGCFETALECVARAGFRAAGMCWLGCLCRRSDLREDAEHEFPNNSIGFM